MKKHNYRFTTYIIFVVLLIFIAKNYTSANTAHAVGAFGAAKTTEYEVLAPLPCIPSVDKNNRPLVTCPNGNLPDKVDIKQYIQQTYNLLVAISSVAAVFMIVFGGFQYVSSAAMQDKADGKEKIQNALIGLLLVLSSYLILRTINPEFVNIPAGLVENLNIRTSDQSLAILNGTQYQSQYAAAQTKTNQATAQVASLKEQLATEFGLDPNMSDEELEDWMALASSYGPEASALAGQISAAQENVNSGIVGQHVAEAKSLMSVEYSAFNDYIAKNPGATPTFNAINYEIANVDKIAAAKNAIASNYSDVSAQADINQQAAYTKATLELDGVISVMQNDSDLTNLGWSHDIGAESSIYKTSIDYVNAAQKMMTENVKDPVMQADLQQKISAARDLIAQKAYKK